MTQLDGELVQQIFVESHADGGVHFEFRESGDLAAGLDAAGGDDGVGCSGAERRKIV